MQGKRSWQGRGLCLSLLATIVALLIGLLSTGLSLADGVHPEEDGSGVSETLPASPSLGGAGRSYQELRNWLEKYRDAEPIFQPGQRLTAKDQEALKPFIPISAWEYYFFPDMEMEIAPTGTYPPPEGWGENRVDGYYLKEDGSLIGFTGGGFPFPEIQPDDPQAAVKVLWNMLWRPRVYDYYMPHVMWSRSPGGKLDREFQFITTSIEFAKGTYWKQGCFE